MRRTFTFAILALALVGCTSSVQTTSGADYLRRADAALGAGGAGSSVDAEVRAIAAIEPQLRFPARIGLARIENGSLTAAPADELELWSALSERLGTSAGELVPVSPLIAAMVAPQGERAKDAAAVVADIRRGAARQHLDYVFIYEVVSVDNTRTNALSAADFTILGMFVLPSRDVEIDATANAVLLDVRNAYPYGTATAFAEARRTTTLVRSGERGREASETARLEAVHNLTNDAHDVLSELMRRAP